MFRDITIGQYYAVDSPVHKLDPRVKLMGTLLYCVLLFLVKNPIWYLPLAVTVLLLYRAANIPLGFVLHSLRAVSYTHLTLPTSLSV